VGRSIGGLEERIINGQTGFIVPDAAAVANVALQLLRNDAVHKSMSAAAGDLATRRTWEIAAMEVEAIVTELGG
jgi:glycosyltransferase involved in cell wall biosynthesis